MKKLIRYFFIVGLFLAFLTGCTWKSKKEPAKEKFSHGPCSSLLEEVNNLPSADKKTAFVTIDISCPEIDDLKDVEVKIFNEKRTYKKIVGQMLGAFFPNIKAGTYQVEVKSWKTEKYGPAEMVLENGRLYDWEITLCKKS